MSHLAIQRAGIILLSVTAAAVAQTPPGTAFTYQGRLTSGGAPISGVADFQFLLYDDASAGNRIAGPINANGIAIDAGLFTVMIDFGATAFTGDSRWLEIAVRSPAGSGAFTTLMPRQAITPAPYARLAAGVATPLLLQAARPVLIRAQNDSQSDGSISIEGVAAAGTGATIGVRGESASLNGKGVLGLANYAFGGSPSGVFGQSDTKNGRGVSGIATAASGTGYGGYFQSDASNGTGIYGKATATTGNPFPLGVGVRGESASLLGRGVHGLATNTTGGNYGGYFESSGSSGTGVIGAALASSGTNFGVRGQTNSPAGYAGYFLGRGYFGGNLGIGTNNPTTPLDVAGVVRSSSGGFQFPDGTMQITAAPPLWHATGNDIAYNDGNVGIGADTPTAVLHLTRPYSTIAARFQTTRYDPLPITSTNGTPSAIAALPGGQPWTNPAAALISDGSFASVSLTETAGGTDNDLSATLEWTNMSVSLPPDANITGISVTLKGYRNCSCTSCGTGTYAGCAVIGTYSLIAAGVTSAQRTLAMRSTDGTQSTGSNYDSWGVSWTPALINATTFGVRVSVNLQLTDTVYDWFGYPHPRTCDCNGSGTAFIDGLTVTIYYQAGTPTTSPVDWSVGIPESDSSFQLAPSADLSSPALTVLTNGRVGLGVTNPANRLELPNTGVGNGRAQAWLTYSSRRWKQNITPIRDALGKLLRLEGVMFDWTAEHGAARDIGFVAEDVGRVVPELVQWEPNGRDAAGLKYDRISALTVEAVKELHAAAQTKDARILRLERGNAELRARLEAIEARLSPSAPRGGP